MISNRLQLRQLFFVVQLGLAFLFAAEVQAQKIYALSGNTLFSFEAANSTAVNGMVAVTGIEAGQVLVGLDVRPATGELYALGYNAGTGAARLYTLNATTGVATAIGAAAIALPANLGDLGFDFNPAVDRVRLTSSTGANYRLHPVTGALVATDGNLAFAAGDVNAGVAPAIGAVAYTNSYIATSSTTLFNYDLALNVFTRQIPPNNGTLNTLGSSGLTLNAANPLLDIDFYTDPNDCLNRGFLVANSAASVNSGLYWFDPTTGAATLIGMIGAGMPVNDIAVAIDRTVPASTTGDRILGLTNNNFLVVIDADRPEIIRQQLPISGITAGQTLVGIDIRPATGELFGLGYNAMTGDARLYILNPDNGVATAVGAAGFTLGTNLGNIAFDFNPTVDRIRVTSSTGVNYRLNPVTGGIGATDTNLTYATGDANAGATASVGTVAYTNSFAGTTSTMLFAYDDVLNVFTALAAPNAGVMTTLGSSGLTLDASQGPGSADLDIVYDAATQQNRAYFSANPAGNFINDNLYRVDLATGALTLVGRIGCGVNLVDLAVTTGSDADGDPGGYCDGKSQGCLRWELVDIRLDAEGDKMYRFRVINNCGSALRSTVFGLPQGITATDYANNSTYTAPSGRTYQVRNPNASPVYSIRFQTQNSVGISGGQSDIFEYTLPEQAAPSFIYVSSRLVNGQSYEAHLFTSACAVQPFDALDNRPAEDRESATVTTADFRMYPNPTSGVIFIDLGAWSAQPVTVTVFNLLGQNLLRAEFPAGESTPAIELPATLVNGVYYVELTTADGQQAVRRVTVNR